MKLRDISIGIALSMLSIFVIFILIEVTLQLFFPIEYGSPPPALRSDDVWRELLHRPSPISGLAYELVPNIEKKSHGVPVQTNSYGMRDSEPRPKDDTSIYRIVAIGDSFTFGLRVSGEDTYPNVLEELLNGTPQDKQFEVLNLGVSGYSARDQALALEYKGLRWDPTLIIVGYYLNDPEIGPRQPLQLFYQERRWWQYSNVFRLIAQAKNYWDIRRLGSGDYFRYLHSPEQAKWQSVLKAFDDIENVTRQKDIPVLLLIFPRTIDSPWSDYPYHDLHLQVANAAQGRGFYVIDMLDQFSHYPPQDLMVIPGDPHPSVLAHAIAARTVNNWLQEKIFLRN